MQGIRSVLVVLVVVGCGGAPKPTAQPVANTQVKPTPAATTDTKAGEAGTTDADVLLADGAYESGIAAVDAGNYEEALDPLLHAFDIYDAKLDAKDDKRADAYVGLIRTYRGLEQWTDAETTARRMLEHVRKHGMREREVTALNQLALGFYEKGDSAEAGRGWEAAIAAQTALSFGMDNSDVRIMHRNLSLAYSALGRHRETLDTLEAVNAWLQLNEPTSLESANTMYMLANEHNEHDENADAASYYTKAVAIYERELGTDDERTVEALAALGTVLWAERDLAPARKTYAKLLAVRQRGVDKHVLAGAYADLGVVECEQEDAAAAIGHLDEAIKMYKLEPQPDADQIITLLMWRSRARVIYRDLPEADADADEAVRMAVELWGPSAPDTVKVIDGLAAGYTDYKQAKKAKAFRARAKKISRAR